MSGFFLLEDCIPFVRRILDVSEIRDDRLSGFKDRREACSSTKYFHENSGIEVSSKREGSRLGIGNKKGLNSPFLWLIYKAWCRKSDERESSLHPQPAQSTVPHFHDSISCHHSTAITIVNP